MNIEFKLNDKESKLAEKFIKKHRHPEVYKGTIGGHMRFMFTPTGIGDGCIVECTICGSKKDITDYSTW